jgi:hypothetical protein
MDFANGSVVRNPPAKQEIQVQSLGQEDPLVKEMATHSKIFAWKIPWTEETGEYSARYCQELNANEYVPII